MTLSLASLLTIILLACCRFIDNNFAGMLQVYCTVRNARITTICLLLAICLAHIHYLIFSQAQKWSGWVCWESRLYRFSPAITGIAEFFVGYLVVPVVFALNIAIICCIRRRRLPRASNESKVTSRPKH